MPREVSPLPSRTRTKLQDACDGHNIKLRDLPLDSPAHHLYVPVLFHPRIEGRFATVTDVGVECGGRARPLDERRGRGRQNRVVLIPRRWDQVSGVTCWRRRLSSPALRGERV
jgi:hypothetical protein